jgi:hypothetical protein
VCVGFWSVEVLALPEFGSPKFQLHDVGPLLDVSVKVVVSGVNPLVGVALNDPTGGIGGGVPPPLMTSCGWFDDASRLLTMRLSVFEPFSAKVMSVPGVTELFGSVMST